MNVKFPDVEFMDQCPHQPTSQLGDAYPFSTIWE